MFCAVNKRPCLPERFRKNFFAWEVDLWIAPTAGQNYMVVVYGNCAFTLAVTLYNQAVPFTTEFQHMATLDKNGKLSDSSPFIHVYAGKSFSEVLGIILHSQTAEIQTENS